MIIGIFNGYIRITLISYACYKYLRGKSNVSRAKLINGIALHPIASYQTEDGLARAAIVACAEQPQLQRCFLPLAALCNAGGLSDVLCLMCNLLLPAPPP